MNFGERLRAAREHADMTQEGLAQRSGVKQGTISKIERGESESSTFAVQLAIACGVRCEWLAIGQGEMLEHQLKPDEHALLEKYRGSSKEGRDAIQRVAESLAKYDLSGSKDSEQAA